MLYQTFRVVAVITSLLGLIYMYSENTYKFSIYPITILIGIAYSSYEKNEEEYYERNKYNIDSGWLTDDDINTNKHTYYQTPNPYTKNGYRTPSVDRKKYTEVAKKCKKNTLVKKQEEEINDNNLTH